MRSFTKKVTHNYLVKIKYLILQTAHILSCDPDTSIYIFIPYLSSFSWINGELPVFPKDRDSPLSSAHLSLLVRSWIYPLGDRRNPTLLWVGHRRSSWPRFEGSLSFQCSYCSTWGGDLVNSFLLLETIYQKFARVTFYRHNKELGKNYNLDEERGFVRNVRKNCGLLLCVSH